MTLDLVATCTFGLEAVVARELAALGCDARPTQTGRVEFRGDAAALARANVQLRTADRVLVKLAEFPAPDFDAVFDTVRDLPWEDWIGPGAAFPVAGRSVKSLLSSVPALQRTVKKGIVERLRRAGGMPGDDDIAEDGPEVPVQVALLKDQATLLLDSSGTGLHKRGYRDLLGAAPLRETLAAALVDLSFWKRGRPLADPFCGSGTIAIEAAMAGRRIAPGLERGFAGEAWSALPALAWTQAREEARDQQLPDLGGGCILASDNDPGALRLAERHAARAGVTADIRFEQRDFRDFSSELEYGCVVTNPPWGERMGHDEEVERLYCSMPDVFADLPTWSFFVLTPWPGFERLVGRPADRRRKLYHARIECTYYQFHGPRPPRADDDGTSVGFVPDP